MTHFITSWYLNKVTETNELWWESRQHSSPIQSCLGGKEAKIITQLTTRPSNMIEATRLTVQRSGLTEMN